MTKGQEKVYAYVAGYITDYGYSPTYTEVSNKLGITVSAVESHLKILAKQGWVKFNGKRTRKIELIPKA